MSFTDYNTQKNATVNFRDMPVIPRIPFVPKGNGGGAAPAVNIDDIVNRVTAKIPAPKPAEISAAKINEIKTSVETAVKESVGDSFSNKTYEPVNVKDFMKTGVDNNTALEHAVAQAKKENRGLFLPDDVNLVITKVINLRFVPFVDFRGVVKVSASGLLIFGHTSKQTPGQVISIRYIGYNATNQSNVIARFSGVKQAKIDIRYCDNLEFFADDSDPTIDSISYCTVELGKIKNFLVTGRGANGSIAEILFIGGSINNLRVTGTFSHNNLLFLKPCFEGGTLNFQAGTRIRAIDARCEGNVKVRFGEATSRIIIEDGFIASPAHYTSGVVVEQNLGVDNEVITVFDQYVNRHEIVTVTPETVLFDNSSTIKGSAIEPGVTHLTGKQWAWLFDSGVVPVAGSTPDVDDNNNLGQFSMKTFMFQSDVKTFRPYVELYDSNLVKIENSGMEMDGGWTWNTTDKVFTSNKDVGSARIVINTPNVKFIRFRVRMGASPKLFSVFRLFGFSPKNSTNILPELFKDSYTQGLVQTTKPTKGYGPVGTVVESGSANKWVIQASEKALVGGTNFTGDTLDINQLNKSFVAVVNDVVGVALENNATHWTTVKTVSGSTITLNQALPSATALNKPIVFVRWSS